MNKPEAKNFVIELARTMFDAYNEHGPHPWKTWNGCDVPRWEALNDQVREKWEVAALKAIHWVGDKSQ